MFNLQIEDRMNRSIYFALTIAFVNSGSMKYHVNIVAGMHLLSLCFLNKIIGDRANPYDK